MNIVVWIKGNRGVRCLEKVLEHGYLVDTVVLDTLPGKDWCTQARDIASRNSITVLEPEDPNSTEAETFFRSRNPDVFILAGYGKILRENIIRMPRVICLNLHGGKLPEYRGSSPMNWALINGESEFGISIIKVDSGVDTGDVVLERSFPIDQNTTIRDLHALADEAFPEMLLDALKRIEAGACSFRKQAQSSARYFPLRFSEDGLILWDQLSANEVHNRVRALTAPYPCAYTYFRGHKVKLIASKLRKSQFLGEPGRIYLKKEGDLLVCAKDQCLWITNAVFEESGEPLYKRVSRYDRLATVTEAVENLYRHSFVSSQ